MNKDQVKGAVKDAEQAGKAVGSDEQQAKGQARQVEGKVEKKVGDVKEAAKDITRKP